MLYTYGEVDCFPLEDAIRKCREMCRQWGDTYSVYQKDGTETYVARPALWSHFRPKNFTEVIRMTHNFADGFVLLPLVNTLPPTNLK